MTIHPRESVLTAFARALTLDPCREAAAAAVAASLGREPLERRKQPPAQSQAPAVLSEADIDALMPEPAIKGDEGSCCGNFTTGGEYMGQREQLCCGQPDGAYHESWTREQVHATVRAAMQQKGGAV